MTTKFKTTMLNWSKFVGAIILFQTIFLSSAFAQTGPIFTYHGRLVDSTTNTAVNGTVNFLIQLQSTNNCLMYEEVQTKALSQGVFALNINSGVGTTTYGQTQSGYSFQSIMSNTNTLNLSYATYSSAAITPAHPMPPVGSCTFTPSPARTDSRKLVVYFFNPSDVTMVSWEPLPVQTVGYVPMAVEALNVGGFPSASLLRFVDGTGNPLATTPLSNANYTELMALLTGTSTTFLKATDPAVGFTGSLNGDVTGLQGATVVSRLRGTAVSATPPIAGQYMVYNGTAWEATNGSGGTVTNVSSGNAYVTVTNPTTTPVVTVNVGTIANTVAAGNDSRIVGAIQTGSGAGGDLAGTYPNPTVSSVGGRTSAQINTSVGDTLAATNTNTASTIVKRDASGNIAVSTASANNFSGRNYLFYNAANTFATTITAPAGLAANLNLTLPNNNGTAGYVLVTDGAGVTSWANPSTGNVTSVGATAPVVSSGGQTPTISMAAATDAVPGYLTAADHNTFNNLRQTTSLATGQVWVGSAGGLAAPKLLNISDIKSSAVGNPNFLNAAGACALGQTLSYSAVTDTLICQAYGITNAQVVSALGGTPITNGLPSNQILVGDAGGVAAPVTLGGDAAISGGNTLTIVNNAITTAKIANGAVTDGKINDVAWGKITGHPTTISGYGITDAVLTNAGGITDMQAGPIASRPAAASANQRYYISTDTQETWFSTAGAWVKIGSAVGLGGTVTNITAGTGLTGGSISTSGTIALANTAVTPAAYGSATLVPTFTVDAQGRLTAAGSVAYQNAGTTGTKGIVDVGSNLTVTAGTLSLTNANVVGALGFTPSNAALPANQIFVGNAGGNAAPVALSGDATIVSSGALTLANSGATAGTYSKVTVDAKGRVTVGAQLNTADITTALGAAPTGSFLVGNAGTATITAMTGDTNVSATGVVTIQPNAVTNAKINDVAWGKVSGTPTTVAGYGITNALLKTGDTMSGALNMGANDITNTGNINMAANKTLLVSNFVTDPLVGSFTAADVGRVWYNTTSNQLKYYNGVGIQIVASASGAVTAVTAGAPLQSSGGLTPNITIPAATTLVDGYLSATDWTTFNAKQPAGSYITALTGDVTAAGPGSAAATIAANAITTAKIGNLQVTDAKINDVAFTKITGKPTTLAGYGITDGASSSLTAGNVFVGSAANIATGVALSGDITSVSNTGVVALKNTGTAGTYGTSTSIPAITTDAQGRVSAVTVNAIPTAATGTTGLLTSADWNTFSGKQAALGFTPVNRAGDTMTGNLILSPNTSLGLGKLTSGQETTLVGTLVAPADVGRTWYNISTNKMMYWDGTIAQVLSAASGSVTSVSSANGDIVVSGTTAPVLTLNSGVGANNILKLNGSSQIPAVSGALLTNLDAGSIATGTLPIARGGTGAVTANAALNNLLPTQATNTNRFLQTDGTNTSWVAGNVGTVTNVTGTAPVSVATGTSTPVISMAPATTLVDGYLSAANFVIFNNKQPAGNYITALTGDVTAAGPGSSASTIANSAVTTAKIADGAVTDIKINDVAWSKVTGRATTLTGYGITDAVRNAGAGAGNVVTSMQSGNTAGRPAFGTDGRIYIDTQAGIIYRDNGTAWVNVGSATGSGGTVTNIATGTGLTGGPITTTGTISLTNVGTAGTYGSATAVPTITVDAQGRITSVVSNAYATATGASLGIVQTGSNITNTAGVISISNANVIAALGTAPTGSFLFGNAGTATIGAMSGDATIGATGVITLANSAGTRTNLGLGTAASPTFTGLTLSGLTDGVVKSTSGVLSGGNSVSLTADVSGILPVANGGTGLATLPAGSLLVGNAAGNVSSLAGTTTGNVVYATGAATWASGTPNAAGLVDLSTAQTIAGTKTFSGNIAMGTNTAEVRFPGSGANYVGFRGPAGAVGANRIWELPAADGTAGFVLRTNGSGVLSWASPTSGSVTSVSVTAPITVSGGAATPTIAIPMANTSTDGYLSSAKWNDFENKLGTATAFAGDVTGTSSTMSVDRIRGTTVTITGLASGNLLKYNGTAWVNSMLALTDIPNMDAAHMPAFTGDVTTTAGSTATTISNGAVTNAKIATGVAWSKIDNTTTPTTVVGYGITDAVRNVGSGAGNVVTTFQSGNTAGRPAAGTDGRIYIDTQAGITYRDNGATWTNVGSANGSGGTVTNVTGTAPITVTTGATTPVISLDNTTVPVGSYGSATAVPSFTVDAQGRLTAAGSNAYATATGASLGIVQTGANITNTAGVISISNANIIAALGAAPTGSFLFGNAGTATIGAMSGDATIGATGIITLADSPGTRTNLGLGTAASPAFTGLTVSGLATGVVKSTSGVLSSSAVSLTADVSGLLPVANGGTGAATLPAGSLLVGNATGAVNSLAAGTTGNVIYATGATTWASATPTVAGLVDLGSAQTITGAKTFDSNITVNNTREIRFPGSGANYVGFRGPAVAVGANRIWELPAADGTVGQVLTTSGAGVLSWSSAATGTVTSVTSANGDIVVSGTTAPVLTLNSGVGANNILKLNGSSQIPAVSGALLTNLDAGSIATGTLPVARGGTGATTLTSGGVLLGNGTTAVTATAAGAVNQVFRMPSSAGAPAFGALDISQAAAVTGTLAVANGGTGLATIPSGSLVVGNGTGTPTTLAGGTTGNMMYATSATTWASGTKDTIGVLANAGNAVAVTAGSTNNTLSLISNNVTRLSFDSQAAAAVTAGTALATISGSAQVNGQAWSTVQTSAAATPLAWDANSGNTMRWTTAGTGLTANITNLKPGASYMLVIKGAGTDQVTITCNGGALPPLFVPANAARVGGTANSKSVYTILNDGENCLITWITGF